MAPTTGPMLSRGHSLSNLIRPGSLRRSSSPVAEAIGWAALGVPALVGYTAFASWVAHVTDNSDLAWAVFAALMATTALAALRRAPTFLATFAAGTLLALGVSFALFIWWADNLTFTF
jgi:hypothetical protein